MNKQGFTYTVLFTFVVSFFFVFLLAMTNELTIDRVRFNQQVSRQRAVLTAMGIPYDSVEAIPEIFARVQETQHNGLPVFRYDGDGESLYAAEFSGSGLWGTIRGVVGVNAEGTRILGLEIIEHNETPGLGGRIDEDWFKEQFRDKRIPENGIQYNEQAGNGDFDPDSGRVDRITGATATSTAVNQILNRYLTDIISALGGESL
jgi:Na+-transporting NADH:ubiquinone oxidoreductase subunit C